MAKKKAELEADRERYQTWMQSARDAERVGMFREALEYAQKAWDHVDGMMQYERRFENAEFDSVAAIDLVLNYAPLLFQFESLYGLRDLLKKQKRIEKNTEADLGAKLERSVERMWQNHRLWSYLEASPDARQDQLRAVLGGDQDYWRSVVEAWEKMGLLERMRVGGSYQLSLATRMGQVFAGKCPKCGHSVEAPKSMLLEKANCPRCRSDVMFVFLQPQSIST
jgi:hypothetical protein